MRRALASISLLLLPFAALAQAQAPIVFFDVAGPASASLPEFYSKLFGWRADPRANGNWSIPVATPLLGTLRVGDPTEKRLYVGVDDVAAKLAEIAASGGTIDAPRFEVAGVAVLGLFKDPAGNPMALVEMQDGKPKIP
jgi:uncharacterized protein